MKILIAVILGILLAVAFVAVVPAKPPPLVYEQF